MARSLEDELKRASRSIERSARSTRKDRVSRKSYSVVPVQTAHSAPLRSQVRPGDAALLRAYGESPWLHIKVVRLASAFASLPYKVVAVSKSGDEKEMPKGHPLWLLLKRPNPMLSGWHLRFLTEVYARTVGGCYWRLRGNALGAAAQIWLYPPNWVQPIFDDKRNISEYQVIATMPGGTTTERVPAKQMFWFQIPDPLEPYSKALGDELSLATEIDTFELASESDRKFFENDATPEGALVVPGRLEQDEVNRMRDDWQRKQGGPENKGNVPVLFGGMDWKTFRAGRREMDFVEGQRYLRDVLIAGVHKHVLGITDDVNFAAAKAADYQVGKWELLPRVQWWEDNLEMIAHTFDERLAVRWENPVPQDEQIELQKANEGLARGAITRNEWRRANKFEEIDPDIGDVFLIQPGYVEVPADGGEPRTFLDPAAPTDGESPVDGGEGGDPNKGTITKATVPVAIVTHHDPDLSTIKLIVDDDKPNPVTKGQADLRIGHRIALNPTGKPGTTGELNIKVGKLDPLHSAYKATLQQILNAFKTEDTMSVLSLTYEAVMESRLDDVKEELGLDPGLSVDDPTLLYYMRNVAGERIRRVDDHTRDLIREQLEEGVNAGEKLSQLEERIGDVFADAKGARAEIIARTETIDASNATAYAAYERSGVVEQVEWLLAGDYDPDEDDHICDELEAAGPVKLGESFLEGIAWPPAHPNCRCAVAPLVEGEDVEVTDRRVEATEADTHDNPADKANQAFSEEFEVFGFEAGGGTGLEPEEYRRVVNRRASEVEFELQQAGMSVGQIAKFSEAADEWTRGSPGAFEHFYRAVHGQGLVDPDIVPVAQHWQNMSQEKLREVTGNAESIRLYRGFSNYAPGQNEGSMSKVLERTFTNNEFVILEPDAEKGVLSSWTTSRDVAESFANQRGYGGVIVQADVKIQDTFGHALINPEWIRGRFLEEQEILVAGSVKTRLAQVVQGTKGVAGEGAVTVVEFAQGEMSWHSLRTKPRAGKGYGHGRRRRRRRWYGEARVKHLNAISHEHARLERQMQGKMKRAFQQQETAVRRELRKAGRDD